MRCCCCTDAQSHSQAMRVANELQSVIDSPKSTVSNCLGVAPLRHQPEENWLKSTNANAATDTFAAVHSERCCCCCCWSMLGQDAAAWAFRTDVMQRHSVADAVASEVGAEASADHCCCCWQRSTSDAVIHALRRGLTRRQILVEAFATRPRIRSFLRGLNFVLR